MPWYKLIWFPLAIPKCGFFLWLACLGRLGTQDRLHLDIPNLLCLLCNGCIESHDHLFFQCPFTKKTWDSVALKCKISPTSLLLPWEDRVIRMVGLCSSKSFSSTIRKLCFAATIYKIWNERNRRLHEEGSREEKEVIWDIIDIVRNRLVSAKNILDNVENRSIQVEWRLPESIFFA